MAAAKQLSAETGTEWFVIKAQIHAGGRGKGTVTETGSHGVVLAKGIDHVEEKVKGILGGNLVTARPLRPVQGLVDAPEPGCEVIIVTDLRGTDTDGE